MRQRIYEGTWEEIAVCASELKGRKVRLIVLDAISGEEKTPPSNSLAEALKGKVGIIEGASPESFYPNRRKICGINAGKTAKKRGIILILCDASALIAVLSRNDNNHQRCKVCHRSNTPLLVLGFVVSIQPRRKGDRLSQKLLL
jgi:hypothetical protein